jgi:hypothetical protein
MLSYSRNTRRADSASRRRALGAGLAVALMSGTALAGKAHQFVFIAYTDAPGGAEVVAGRYQDALEQLSRPGAVELDAAEANTNRCVAYSMTLQWQEARTACDAAVRAARLHQTGAPAWMSWMHAADDESLAVAYSNRAVMHWLSNDGAAASQDLAKAQELSPESDFVAYNVTALEVHTEVALAGVPAPKS